jgi:hypothetical protein
MVLRPTGVLGFLKIKHSKDIFALAYLSFVKYAKAKIFDFYMLKQKNKKYD